MTFTLPEDLAGQLLWRVPARERSCYVAAAIEAKLREREKRLIRACEIANGDPDVLAIEREWGALSDDIDGVAEPWKDAPVR